MKDFNEGVKYSEIEGILDIMNYCKENFTDGFLTPNQCDFIFSTCDSMGWIDNKPVDIDFLISFLNYAWNEDKWGGKNLGQKYEGPVDIEEEQTDAEKLAGMINSNPDIPDSAIDEFEKNPERTLKKYESCQPGLTLKEQAREIKNNIDFIELHKELVFSNGEIWVYKDGTITHQTCGTIPNPENGEGPILCLKTHIFDMFSYDYYEGWGHFDEDDPDTFITDDGKKLTREDAVIDAIENGDWTEWYDQIEEEIYRNLEDLEEEKEAEEYRKLEQEAYEEYTK